MPANGSFAPIDLAAVAQLMRDLDICMLSTTGPGGVATRPMSNNGQVEYDGDTWFFARRDSAKIREIEAVPSVGIGYVASERATWIAIEADAEVVYDPAEKRARWFEDLGRWFENGPEDPEVVLIRASATRIRAWGRDGDVDIQRAR